MVLLSVPASALAAQRFASPGGSGTACSHASPCSLVTAINGGAAADEVIVAGNQGPYGTQGSPIGTKLQEGGSSMQLHGAAGQPMPVIYLNVPGDNALQWNLGGTVSDLHVQNLAPSGTGLFTINGDHLIARGGSTGCLIPPGATIIDTVCVGGSNGLGANSSTSGTVTSTFRNVTAIGQTNEGMFFDAFGFTWDVSATNVIAQGGSKDIETSESSGSVNFNLDHSNYASVQQSPGTSVTVAGSGTNQTAAPVFVNAAADDFHQAPGSPTINHGGDDPLNGLTDFEGKPRTFGAHTDIGGDEYAPPAVLAESASSVTTDSAVLGGSVNVEGAPATARIEFGPTTAYGSKAPAGGLALSASPQGVSAAIGGLTSGTTYHYRLVAINGSGPATGPDQTFTTASSGLRAAALKKCKKRAHKHHWSKKKRRKCRKKAERQPL